MLKIEVFVWFTVNLLQVLCKKYKKHLKTAEFAKNAYGGLHFSAKLKAKG